ncbi:MAG: HAMP domain-containing histidine kinase [Lactobacillaceae bacterium]|jgi:signal transduction histidine kinase|nr:HAMP domain-containing histidine kinase [Lactobacillaceae bacterium]
MRFSNTDIRKLITFSLVIFLLLLAINFIVDSFILSIIHGAISLENGGIRFIIGSGATIQFNLSIFSIDLYIVLLVFAGTGWAFYWLLMTQVRKVQLEHITYSLEIMNEDGLNEPIIARYSDKPTDKLLEQINLLSVSKQKIIDNERSNENLQRELVGNISHDLRTPLTSIGGYFSFLRDTGETAKPETIVDIAKKGFAQSQTMRNMIEELFEYTQSQNLNTDNFNYSEMNISDFLNQLMAQFEMQVVEKNMTMEVYTQPEDIKIIGDPDKLARVLMNLINNALKYAKTATFIKLLATKINDENIEIYVQNDGEPIAKSDQKKLFDRFYRVDKSRNKSISGNGLGLSIARGIILQHHGQIRVESNEQLTSFIITLPINGGLD